MYNVLSECWMGKLNVKIRAVMIFYLVLAINADIDNANFNYAECGLYYHINLVCLFASTSVI